MASSNAVVGTIKPPISEEILPYPISPYGCSKLLAESYCKTYSNLYGIETCALRFSNVYGPGSLKKGSVVAVFIKQALCEEGIIIYGTGKQTRDFIYIDDLIEGILCCVNQSLYGETICLGTGNPISINKISNLISKHSEEWSQKHLSIKKVSERTGDVIDNYSNPEKAQKVLNFKAKTDIEDGIQKTWDWFVNYWLPSVKLDGKG